MAEIATSVLEVRELTGLPLDWAMAKVGQEQGLDVHIDRPIDHQYLAHRFDIRVRLDHDAGGIKAAIGRMNDKWVVNGPTTYAAVCRAFILFHHGPEIEVPQILLG